ncbi:MAG: alpha/beta hydrolase [Pseudomonadota bacterium]
MESSSFPTSSEVVFSERTARIDDINLHYRIGGTGSPVVLMHGYAETGHMWNPVMPDLAKIHTVIVPDLRGTGASEKPATGYDKKTMAQDIHGLVKSLGFDKATIVGHDIGLMVAYAYAAQYPDETDHLVLMDAFLPGIGNWKDMWLMRDLWHFHFYGDVPLALVAGRERIYFEHFWNDFAANPRHSIPEADRQIYAEAYAQPGGMRAGFEYFRNFEQDAMDFQQFARNKLTMPVRVISGEKSGGEFLIDQVRLVANDVQGKVIQGSGHWLLEEGPEQVIPVLNEYVH